MTQEQINAIILDFLKAYKAWADEDAPEGSCFERYYGLCSNLTIYANEECFSPEYFAIVKDAFKAMLGGNTYPFSSSCQYEDECWARTHHRNPARMAWVNEQIERMEK